MHKTFGRHLEVIRKKSGLSQRDCAHLLDLDQARYSRIELGEQQPTARQLCKLSLIFGKPLECLLDGAFGFVRKSLAKRLSTMPRSSIRFRRLANRQHTLNALAERLETEDDIERGGRV